MTFLTLTNIQKSFGPVKVVHDFNMSIDKGEFISFLGPSGCGKTTILRMVAGFETPTSGTVVINGKDQVRLKPNQRNIGMVFQAYALFPNMNVFDNVAFGLKINGMAKPDIEKRVKEMLSLIHLDHLGERYPYQLSGGQQQRVALARALAPKPQVHSFFRIGVPCLSAISGYLLFRRGMESFAFGKTAMPSSGNGPTT